MGEKLAYELQNTGFKNIVGSTTSLEKKKRIEAKNITCFEYLADQTSINSENAQLFDASIIVVTIPPRLRSGNGANYIDEISSLITNIDKDRLKKIIYTSSTSVYANESGIYNENGTLEQDNIIREVEKLFLNTFKDKAYILRLSGLCGPGRNLSNFFIRSGRIPADVSNCVNMVHQDDVVRAIISLINKEEIIKEKVFNICADLHPLRRDFYSEAFMAQNKDLPKVEFDINNVRLIDNSLFKSIFDFEYKFKDPLLFTY